MAGIPKELDKSEYNRVSDILNPKEIKNIITPYDLFRNESIAKDLEATNNSLLSGFDSVCLINNVVFNEKIFLEVCPTCKCVNDPSLLIPYLNRDLVIPIFGASYSMYPRSFVNAMQSFPHISAYEYYMYRSYILLQKYKERMDPRLVDSYLIKGEKELKSHSKHVKSLFNSVFTNIQPYLNPDALLLTKLIDQINSNKINNIQEIYDISHIVRELRSSQAFKIIPQLDLKDLEFLEQIQQVMPEKTDYELTDIKELILNGLMINYNDSIPLDAYLDIMLERRNTISKIVENIIKKNRE